MLIKCYHARCFDDIFFELQNENWKKMSANQQHPAGRKCNNNKHTWYFIQRSNEKTNVTFGMFRNVLGPVPECFGMLRNVSGCSGMFWDVPECFGIFQDVPRS